MKLALLLLVASCAGSAPYTAAPTAAPGRRLGDAMDEAGMRFGRAGRAVLSGRYELAGYDLHELDEIFSDDLATSTWHGKAKLADLARTFASERIPALRAAVTAHDRAGYERAAADAARACNDCHKAADQAYIEISPALGAEVPTVTASK